MAALAVDPQTAAPAIGVTVGTLKRWRREGTGPAYCRIGNRVRYRVADLDDWLQNRKVTPGSAPP